MQGQFFRKESGFRQMQHEHFSIFSTMGISEIRTHSGPLHIELLSIFVSLFSYNISAGFNICTFRETLVLIGTISILQDLHTDVTHFRDSHRKIFGASFQLRGMPPVYFR